MGVAIGRIDVADISIGRRNIEESYVGRDIVQQGSNFFTADNFTFETADGYVFNSKE